jgi:hypothetical protein
VRTETVSTDITGLGVHWQPTSKPNFNLTIYSICWDSKLTHTVSHTNGLPIYLRVQIPSTRSEGNVNVRGQGTRRNPPAHINALQTHNSVLQAQLETKDDQIRALTEQTAALTKTLDQSQQLLAVQTQTTQQLTDQLDSSRQLIEDIQRRSTVWQRLKAVFASA